MTEKSRNFRSSYYDKVGFRGVEEKKSLEILINEKPMDKSKLSKFCLRFTLPSIYREFVWKVLLGVVPLNSESHKSVMDQRHEHYAELKQALEVMHKINENTIKSVVHMLMYLMTEELLLFNHQAQLKSLHIQNLTALANVFLKLSSSDVTGYWLFKNFVINQKKNNVPLKSLREQFETILKKEDDMLYEHLKKTEALEILPVDLWFGRYFAEILHQTSLARIYDKVIGGSCKILPYVGASILIIFRHPLLALDTPDKIVKLLEKIPEDTSDIIVNKSLDLHYS